MESLFENIIPLLFVLLYVLSGFFRRNKKEEGPSSTEPSYPQPEDEPHDLREEIRRRLQDNTHQLQEEIEPLPPFSPPVAEPIDTLPASVEELIHSQREHLAEMQQRVGDIWQPHPSPSMIPHQSEVSSMHIEDGFRERLRNPKTFGEAIVLMEILGTPVGLRKPGEDMRPNW